MRATGDPVWTADGVVSDRWLPVSPNGRLDGYQWRLPLAEIGVSRPVIEVIQPPAPPQQPVEAEAAEPPSAPEAETEEKPAAKPEAKPEAKTEEKPEPRRPRRAKRRSRPPQAESRPSR